MATLQNSRNTQLYDTPAASRIEVNQKSVTVTSATGVFDYDALDVIVPNQSIQITAKKSNTLAPVTWTTSNSNVKLYSQAFAGSEVQTDASGTDTSVVYVRGSEFAAQNLTTLKITATVVDTEQVSDSVNIIKLKASQGSVVYTGYLYLQNASYPTGSPPPAPSGGSYNFATSVLTPPTSTPQWSTVAPAVSATVPTWVCQYNFVGTSTSIVTAGAWQNVRLDNVSSSQGLPGANAKTVRLTTQNQVFTYTAAGTTPNPTTTVITAIPQNISGTVYYEFLVDNALQQNTTSASFTYTPKASFTDLPDLITVNAREGSSTGTIVASDILSIIGVKPGAPGADGASAITVVLSNEVHVFPSTSTGVIDPVTGYDNSGTQIRVYEGATELSYDGVGTSNGTWRVASVTTTNITAGTISDSGTYATVNKHSGVSNSVDSSKITYNITGKTASGTSFTVPKDQTFAKSKQGIGAKSVSLSAFIWSLSAPSVGSTPATYNWSTKTVSTYPAGWTSSAPASPGSGYTLYQITYNVTDNDSATITSFDWSNAVRNAIGFRQDGSVGPVGDSYRTAYAVTTSATPPTPITADTGDKPPTTAGVTWSFTATSILEPGQYMYQVDGIINNNPNTTGYGNITWGAAYLSNLKVGSLSSLAVDTGNLTISTTGSIKTATNGTYGTAGGFFLGYDSDRYKFSIGDKLLYNGTTLTVPAITIDDSGNVQGIGSGAGTSVANNTNTLIRNPEGGTYLTTEQSVTGAIKIRLPVGTSYPSMPLFYVDIYEYAAGFSCILQISGHNWTDGSWYNCSATVIGASNVEYPVRFGRDSSGYFCVYIGSSTESWSYPQIRVRDVTLGWGSQVASVWSTNWGVSFVSTFENITQTVLDSKPGADWSKTAKRPSNLAALSGSEAIQNTLISINSNGTLLGAGGGQVSLSGLGFTGETNATYGLANATQALTGSRKLKIGTLDWNGSTGAWVSGYGVGLSESGIAAYNSSGTSTFSINATNGNAYFAGTLGANVVKANNIEAGAVSLNKLTVTSNPALNLCPDPTYLDTSAWQVASWGIKPLSVTDVAGQCFYVSSGNQASVRLARRFPIAQGRRYKLSVKVWRGSDANGTLYLRVDSDSTAVSNLISGGIDIGLENITPPAQTWTTYTAEWVATSSYASPMLILNHAATSGGYYATDLRFEEMVQGSVIVDGAVTAQKIDITAGQTTGRIVINNNQILVYDTAGNVRVKIGRLIG